MSKLAEGFQKLVQSTVNCERRWKSSTPRLWQMLLKRRRRSCRGPSLEKSQVAAARGGPRQRGFAGRVEKADRKCAGTRFKVAVDGTANRTGATEERCAAKISLCPFPQRGIENPGLDRFDPRQLRNAWRRSPAPVPLHSGGRKHAPFQEGSGRLELARAIADRNNPLTARVMVNRIWQHHFGQGLVRTPSNFGLLGEPPTHPELLDYLAARFDGTRLVDEIVAPDDPALGDLPDEQQV